MKFKSSGLAKIKKNEQDHELNLKKIEKIKVAEKDLNNEIEKKVEELKVVSMNLSKLE